MLLPLINPAWVDCIALVRRLIMEEGLIVTTHYLLDTATYVCSRTASGDSKRILFGASCLCVPKRLDYRTSGRFSL